MIMTKREKLLKIAKKQIGTIGGSKYRQWYNTNVGNIGAYAWPWCAAGLSWCANQAGFSETEFPPTASAPQMLYNFQNAGRFGKRGSYTPKPADIIIFRYAGEQSDASHVGMVEYVKDGYVHTIEFNSGTYYADGCVGRYQYLLAAGFIVGYGITVKNEKIKLKSDANIYTKAYKDILGNSSKVIAKLKKGTYVTYVDGSDDGTGWCKIKFKNNKIGWIMNSHFKKGLGLSKFLKKTLAKPIKAILIKKKKANKTVTLKKGTKYKIICTIENGKYKNKKYIGIGRKRYYI